MKIFEEIFGHEICMNIQVPLHISTKPEILSSTEYTFAESKIGIHPTQSFVDVHVIIWY